MSIRPRSAFSLVEVVVALAILAVAGTVMGAVLQGNTRWGSNAASEDALADDILNVWKTFNDDLGQSAWYIPDTTQGFGVPSLANDRALLYAPFVFQPAVTGAPTAGQPTNPQFQAFNRAGFNDVRFEGSPVADLDRCKGFLTGLPSDRNLPPSAFASTRAYLDSYFARSQELIFVRATSTLWNPASDRPVNVTIGNRQVQAPMESFPGTTATWQGPGNHTALKTLLPSGWQRDSTGNGWNEITPGNPYGRVMDAAYLYSGSGSIDLKLQVEQNRQPDFQNQDPTQVRWFTYAVVPSPNGLGRLVRAMLVGGAAPARGTDPGRCLAVSANGSLVVDRILSENVVRVMFDTARHADDIGVGNVRATVYFARMPSGDNQLASPAHRAVTMVFAMRAANSWQDKSNVRSLIKTSTAIAAGSIPFTY